MLINVFVIWGYLCYSVLALCLHCVIDMFIHMIFSLCHCIGCYLLCELTLLCAKVWLWGFSVPLKGEAMTQEVEHSNLWFDPLPLQSPCHPRARYEPCFASWRHLPSCVCVCKYSRCSSDCILSHQCIKCKGLYVVRRLEKHYNDRSWFTIYVCTVV